MNPLKDVRKIPKEELGEWLKAQGEKAFRARQIEDWLWKKSATTFDEMTSLSLTVRELLKENFVLRPIKTRHSQRSSDGTVKSVFSLWDENLIEGVLIPASNRMTACVSSQVGCSLSCKFCATGYMTRTRNLDVGEIYDQVVCINAQATEMYALPLTNIVFMGMGEPLLNYANVLAAIDKITSPEGLGMSAKRITLSTAGVAKMIKKLGEDQVRFRLALSLHAATDAKRNQIMPINETNTLENLVEALRYFYERTGSRITFEYIVFDKFNDSLDDARQLWELLQKVPARVNIIEYNPIAEADFKNAGIGRIRRFSAFLEDRGAIVNIRHSRGKDIDAACGQLANKEHKAQPA